jgi:hypothetical protein
MRKMLFMAALAVAALILVPMAVAGEGHDHGAAGKEVTVTGKILCAKCTLKKADAKGCQDVLVADEGGKSVEYYLTKNDVAEKYGHVCQGEKAVVATGTVMEKDGKTWLTATKMEAPTKG